jgi:cytidine deaminase
MRQAFDRGRLLLTGNRASMVKEERFEMVYQVHDDPSTLSAGDRELVERAAAAAKGAWAVYSRFHVGAALRLENGTIVIGSNQENASYPAGICAERAALHAAMAQFPGERVVALAVSAPRMRHGAPVTPCGICRQAMDEQRRRQGGPLRLLLSGEDGPVYVFNDSNALLPLAFDPVALGA